MTGLRVYYLLGGCSDFLCRPMTPQLFIFYTCLIEQTGYNVLYKVSFKGAGIGRDFVFTFAHSQAHLNAKISSPAASSILMFSIQA